MVLGVDGSKDAVTLISRDLPRVSRNNPPVTASCRVGRPGSPGGAAVQPGSPDRRGASAVSDLKRVCVHTYAYRYKHFF